MESRERRSSERKQQQASVCLAVEKKNYGCNIQLRDISLDGMLVHPDEKVEVHTNCVWELTLIGPSSSLVISGKGRIIRQDSRGAAIKFTEIEMDSYSYLKNIVFGNSLPDNA